MSRATAIRPARMERTHCSAASSMPRCAVEPAPARRCGGHSGERPHRAGCAGQEPLVFDGLTLAHKPQQRFRAGAQGGDEKVNVVKRLAVTQGGAHQLDDPPRRLLVWRRLDRRAHCIIKSVIGLGVCRTLAATTWACRASEWE
jgi:hypothetical protein